MKKYLLVLIIIGLAGCTSKVEKDRLSSTTLLFPEPKGYVNDFEHLFSEQEKDSLELIIINYERETTREIAVITVDTISPMESVKDYAVAIANEWGVGKKDKDNGLVIVFSKAHRGWFVASGKGTELMLTDTIIAKVNDTVMLPEFKNDNYYLGIKKGILALIEKWE